MIVSAAGVEQLLFSNWHGIFYLIVALSANALGHHQPKTRRYQQLRINAAAREIAHVRGERYIPSTYSLVADVVYRTRFLSAPVRVGASNWCHSFNGSWWLGGIK